MHSTPGPGLLESLYQKAMCIELKYRHISYDCQSPYEVYYRNESIVKKNIESEIKTGKTGKKWCVFSGFIFYVK
jgi:GxxExxY protein